MAAVSRHCCSNKRTLIKYGYLKPVRLCNKCNASCFKADLLLNAVWSLCHTWRSVHGRVCMTSPPPFPQKACKVSSTRASCLMQL